MNPYVVIALSIAVLFAHLVFGPPTLLSVYFGALPILLYAVWHLGDSDIL